MVVATHCMTMTERAEAAETNHDPDRGTLERVASGDFESFALLVDRHQQRLLRLCQSLLHDDEEARDAVQEVFLKAFRKAGRFRPRGQVYTWLYRIAVNHCLNRLRRHRIVRFLTFGEMTGEADETRPSPFEPRDLHPGPERRLVDRQRWRAAKQQIARLPPGQRAVLVLAKIEGLSYRQIAEALGISEGAVESRLFRAMRTLSANRNPSRAGTQRSRP